MAKHEHYKRNVSHLKTIDVYRIIELFEITCPVAQHVLKKAMVTGKRGHKDLARDWQDILDSAERRLEMLAEDKPLDGDGWIEWGGGECPVLPDVMVEVKMQCGAKGTGRAGDGNWFAIGNGADIIAYRVISP